jgi:hypothetical protein
MKTIEVLASSRLADKEVRIYLPVPNTNLASFPVSFAHVAKTKHL